MDVGAVLIAGPQAREGVRSAEAALDALEIAAEKPEGSNFLIPVRLEPCAIPRAIRGVMQRARRGRRHLSWS